MTRTLKIALRLFLTALALYAGLVAYMYLRQEALLYHPDPILPAPSATRAPEMKVDTATTSDGLTNVYWYSLSKTAPYTVVIFHGNARNMAALDKKAAPLIHAGYGAVLVEYRGFGGNAGRPTEDGLMNDARAVIDQLVHKHHIPKRQMIFYGESLGSGVAVPMASENPDIAGLILEVPFDSTLSVAQGMYPYILGLRYLMRDQYHNDALIGALKMPKLVMVAGQDVVVPPNHARRLFDLAAPPKKKVEFPDGQHNNLYDLGADKVVLKFIKTLASPPSPARADMSGVKPPAPPETKVAAVPTPQDLARIEPAAAAPSMFPEQPKTADTASVSPPGHLKTETIRMMSAGRLRAVIQAEVAIKPADQQRGLQNRTSLPPDHGMMFIFPQTTMANFWMKDTLIPLDMVFIDQEGRIIKIHENAAPKDESIISSGFPARAVLELNGGAAKSYGLSIGDLVLSPTLDQTVADSMALNN